MQAVVPLEDQEGRTAKQKAFRKQFAANLNAALDQRGTIPAGYGRVVAVAELFGVSQTTAAIWLKGDGVPELSRLSEIALILGTTIEQLVNGDQGAKTAELIDERYVVLDVHGSDESGGHSCYILPETLRFMGLPNTTQMFLVDNDDMAPYLNKGDLAIYDSRVKRIQTNGVFVLQIDGQFLVRRIQRGSVKRNIRLICDNPTFEDEIFEESEFGNTGNQTGITVAGYVVGRIILGS